MDYSSRFWGERLLVSTTYHPNHDVLILVSQDNAAAENRERLQLTFESVRSIQLDFEAPLTVLNLFCIVDISDAQLKSLRYLLRG